MKKQLKEKKNLTLHKDTVRLLGRSDAQKAVGGNSNWDSCFPNICLERDSSGC